MVRTSNHISLSANDGGQPSPSRWLRIHGLAQVRAAWAVWPRTAGPLCLLGPDGAAETLGPGWPEAVRAALVDEARRAAPGVGPASTILAVDCGAAVGFALAILGRWMSEGGGEVGLLLGLNDSVPDGAWSALVDRATMGGVLVQRPCPRPSLDLGPTATADRVREGVRALAGSVDGQRG